MANTPMDNIALAVTWTNSGYIVCEIIDTQFSCKLVFTVKQSKDNCLETKKNRIS